MAKRTGRPPGRPRKAAQAIPAVEEVEAGRATPDDAAQAAGVGKRTLERYRAKARLGAASGSSARPQGPGHPDTLPARSAPASGLQGAPADRRAAVVALLVEAVDGDAELLERLPLDVAELRRRLGDPGLLAEGDLDPLAILRRVQARLEEDMRRLPPAAVVARKGVAGALVQLAAGAERIAQGRPPVGETPEQIVARMIEARRDDTLAKVFEHVEAAESEAA